MPAHGERDPGHDRPTSRASPSMASPRIRGVTPAAQATFAAASSASCGRATTSASACAGADRRAWASPRRRPRGSAARPPAARCRISPAPRAHRRSVTHPRPSGPSRSPRDRPRHVRDRERHNPRGRGGEREAPALDRREMLAHCVHLIDRRAALRRARTVSCLSSSARPGAGRVSSAEPPPEIQHQDQVVRRQPAHALQDPAGGGAPRQSGTGAPPPPPRSGGRAGRGHSASPALRAAPANSPRPPWPWRRPPRRQDGATWAARVGAAGPPSTGRPPPCASNRDFRSWGASSIPEEPRTSCGAALWRPPPRFRSGKSLLL